MVSLSKDSFFGGLAKFVVIKDIQDKKLGAIQILRNQEIGCRGVITGT